MRAVSMLSAAGGRVPIVLALIVLLNGCVAVPSGYSFTPTSSDGVVVLSTRLADDCGGSLVTAMINYEGLVDNRIERGWFLMAHGMIKPEFADPPGYFHVRPLRAGTYRFTTFRRTSTKGTFESDDWDVRFRVEPGETIYLGEVHATLDGCWRVNMEVNDERSRDGTLFDQKMKTLKSSAFEYRLADFSRKGVGPR